MSDRFFDTILVFVRARSVAQLAAGVHTTTRPHWLYCKSLCLPFPLRGFDQGQLYAAFVVSMIALSASPSLILGKHTDTYKKKDHVDAAQLLE